MLQHIRNRYGTHRGLIRLYLDTIKWKLGQYEQYERVNWFEVKRLVFVCQGNICRSPYAHYLALKQLDENVASIGFATTTGVPANDRAKDVARVRGTSLDTHIATDLRDFDIVDGDLFLVMEGRHISKLGPIVSAKQTQLSLLGLWATPSRALIYDPYDLSEAYFHSCFEIIESAVANVVNHYLEGRG